MLDLDTDVLCPGIESILNQFFHHAGGALDDAACSHHQDAQDALQTVVANWQTSKCWRDAGADGGDK